MNLKKGVHSVKRKRIVKYIILVVLFLIVALGMIILIKANQPYARAKKEAVELAEKYAKLDHADEFYWYSRDHSYFSLVGTDTKGKKIIVIIPKSGEKVTVFNQADGINKAQAIKTITDKKHPYKILKVTLGMEQDEPVWEITTENEKKELSYYLLSFESGEIIKETENM